jgi:hypothetical protein
MKKDKEICGTCKEKMAVWIYVPGYSNGASPYKCNDCISSVEWVGCACNWRFSDVNAYHPPLDKPELPEGIEGKDWKWVVFAGDEHMEEIKKEEGVWQYVDEMGRPYPCCEYDYEEDGFDKEI